MSRIVLGIICGLVFGAIDIGIMLPMAFPDKKAAIMAAFIARFGIGFVIGAGPSALARLGCRPILWFVADTNMARPFRIS